jgi:hypothetical protein
MKEGINSVILMYANKVIEYAIYLRNGILQDLKSAQEAVFSRFPFQRKSIRFSGTIRGCADTRPGPALLFLFW